VKPVYTNDRTAPRMKKAEFSTQVVTKQLWKEFKKEFPEYKDLTWDEFFQDWKEIAETYREEAIYNPLGTKLGSYAGELKLQYLPHKFVAVDPAVSAELGEKTKHLNIVNKGKVGKIKWERRWAVKFNKMLQFFAFEETRELNKMAKIHLDEHPEKPRVARNTLGGYSVWRQLRNR
jgi:hypothetical protein